MIQDAITAIKEKEFHNNRRIFAYYDGKLNFCEEVGLSHHEWLVGGRLFCDFVFNDLVRGYVDSEGVYFYRGDFQTDEYTENTAKSCLSYFDENLPVYCGVFKGEIGEKWKPIYQIR